MRAQDATLEAVPHVTAQGSAWLNELFRQHYGRVKRWVLQFGVASCDVEDVAQEVFVVAYKKRPNPAHAQWLFVVTRNVCSNWRRSKLRAEHRKEQVRWISPQADFEGLELAPDRLERARRFQSFLDGLPNSQVETFVLYVVDGLKPQLISKQLGIPVETVRTRIWRAKNKFNEWLKGQDDDGSRPD